MTCREFSLPRDEKSSDPKGWIRGNTEIGPVLEVTTSYLQDKYEVEIRIEFVNKDNFHSRVRISHGLNKLFTDSSNKEDDDNEQETSTTKTEVFTSASRSKAEAKPRRPSTAWSSSRTGPVGQRIWIDIEPGAQSNQAYPVAERINTLLRHGELPREEDGAIEFWSLKDMTLRKIWVLSILVWWFLEEQDGRRRKQQEKISILYWPIKTRNSLSPSSSRSFRTQSHWSYTAGQFLIPNRVFEYIYHIGCAVSLHSIKFRIDSGRTKIKQGKTDGILYSLESHE